MKKVVILSGSGISAESGIPTFRIATDSLWENYDVKTVCTHMAWVLNPSHVNKFYNMLRVKYSGCKPNNAHLLIHTLEEKYDVTVITQNVDNLHEQAGSINVVHLHGEVMKCCSEHDTENKEYWVTLPQEGFGESGLEIPEDTLAGDGSLLRPYIVFFDEPVPNMETAMQIVAEADLLIVVGTSLTVYPAAGLVDLYDPSKPLVVIDPEASKLIDNMQVKNVKSVGIDKTASEGMKQLCDMIDDILI